MEMEKDTNTSSTVSAFLTLLLYIIVVSFLVFFYIDGVTTKRIHNKCVQQFRSELNPSLYESGDDGISFYDGSATSSIQRLNRSQGATNREVNALRSLVGCLHD